MNFENALYPILAVEVPLLWGKKNIVNNILNENSNTIRIDLQESFFHL